MARGSREIFAEDDVPDLRFEDAGNEAGARSAFAQHGGMDEVASDDDPYEELKQKQEALLRIRQQLERTQRETEELEIRKNKEERFSHGRRDICERLSRSLAKLDRELYNSQKAIEEISATREAFQHHLDALCDIHPELWHRNELDVELDRAIGAVEDAEEEYAKSMRRIAAVVPMRENMGPLGGLSAGSLPTDFKGWMLLGLAFTLPMIVAALLAAILVVKLGS